MKPETLTLYQRLSLINQYEILSRLDETTGTDYEHYIRILGSGYAGMYDELFETISEEVPPEITEEIEQILHMYIVINNCVNQLNDTQKEEIDLRRLDFEGFDGHQEHYHQYSLLRDMDRYEMFEDYPMDSHSGTSIVKYRKMLREFNQIIESKDRHELSFEELQQIAQAAFS